MAGVKRGGREARMVLCVAVEMVEGMREGGFEDLTRL